MRLLHIHFHPPFKFIPHFAINGFESLQDELTNGNVTRRYWSNGNKAEYLQFKQCPVCQGNQKWFGFIKQ